VGNGTEMWLQIDFENSTAISGAEIAFFANEEQGFDAPKSYKVQVKEGNEWVDVKGAAYGDVVADGITEVEWEEVNGEVIRLVFMPKVGMRVRVVEFKVY
jgi:hypothetical protein